MSGRSEITARRHRRQADVDRMSEIVSASEREGRDLRPSEREEFDRLERQSQRLTGEIDDLESRETLKPSPGINRAALPVEREARGGGPQAETATLTGWAQRSVFESTGGGSFLVPPEYAHQLFDRLAAASVGLRSGFQIMQTGSSSLHIPTLTADAASAWVAEGAAITPTDPGFTEVIATPRKLAALVQLSNEMRRDSNPDVVTSTTMNLFRSLALKLDLGFFEGSGTPPEIKGLKNVSGIGTVTTLGANGGTPTSLDPFADAIATLAANNATADAIVMNPRTWSTLTKLKTGLTGDQTPLLAEAGAVGFDTTGQPRRSIYGVPVFVTSQLSITETRGTSTDTSSAYVYQADQVVAVRRADVQFELDTSRLFHQDMAELRAISRWDVVVPNPTAIVRIVGIRP